MPKSKSPSKPETVAQQETGGGCQQEPCSLVDCPPGKMTAKLPYFREKPLPVQVEHWKTLDGKHQEKTVSLLQGSIKNRYLSDTELEGAEFYPENASVMARPDGGPNT